MNPLRPYPPTGLTTARWKAEVPVRRVYMPHLVFTQPEISLIKMVQSIQGHPNMAGDDYPHVVVWNGTMYLEDGHHRVAVRLIRGHLMVEARVYEA